MVSDFKFEVHQSLASKETLLRRSISEPLSRSGVELSGQGVYGMAIQYISARRKGEAGQLELALLHTSGAGSSDPDATSPQRDFAPSRSGSTRLSIWVSLPARTAEILPILFHHCRQHLLPGGYAQIEERSLDAGIGSQNREGNLRRRGAPLPRSPKSWSGWEFLACFFMVVAPSWFGNPLRTTRRAKEPPLYFTGKSTGSGTSPKKLLIALWRYLDTGIVLEGAQSKIDFPVG